MPTPAYRDLQCVHASEIEGGRDVVRVEAPRDHGWPTIDHSVEAAARRLVPGILRDEHRAGQRPPQLRQALVNLRCRIGPLCSPDAPIAPRDLRCDHLRSPVRRLLVLRPRDGSRVIAGPRDRAPVVRVAAARAMSATHDRADTRSIGDRYPRSPDHRPRTTLWSLQRAVSSFGLTGPADATSPASPRTPSR